MIMTTENLKKMQRKSLRQKLINQKSALNTEEAETASTITKAHQLTTSNQSLPKTEMHVPVAVRVDSIIAKNKSYSSLQEALQLM
jgi:hypothetical protein